MEEGLDLLCLVPRGGTRTDSAEAMGRSFFKFLIGSTIFIELPKTRVNFRSLKVFRGQTTTWRGFCKANQNILK